MYPLLILWGGIVAVDTTSGPQILISEPIVSCSLLGILFGAPETGLMIGILFQLLWLGYLPLGGTVFTDSNLAAYISTAAIFIASDFFDLSGTSMKAALIPAMLFSVIIGIIGLHIHSYEQQLNGERNDRIISCIENGEISSILFLHSMGIATAFLKGVLMTVIFIPAGAILCGIVSYLPFSLLKVMSQTSMVIIGTVTASAIAFYHTKGRTKSLIIGSIGGIIWILFILQKID
ncbi:PTS sugar transporter subunit IIC [Candidatus Latescibacterota bacterium]